LTPLVTSDESRGDTNDLEEPPAKTNGEQRLTRSINGRFVLPIPTEIIDPPEYRSAKPPARLWIPIQGHRIFSRPRQPPRKTIFGNTAVGVLPSAIARQSFTRQDFGVPINKNQEIPTTWWWEADTPGACIEAFKTSSLLFFCRIFLIHGLLPGGGLFFLPELGG